MLGHVGCQGRATRDLMLVGMEQGALLVELREASTTDVNSMISTA